MAPGISPGQSSPSTVAWVWGYEGWRSFGGTGAGCDDKEQMTVDSEAAFEKFKGCAVEVLQVPADKVTREARFADDLDADSLDLVELVMALEESFDITVDENEIEGVETVSQAFELVTSKI